MEQAGKAGLLRGDIYGRYWQMMAEAKRQQEEPAFLYIVRKTYV